ncbi:hypothetical protein GCM10009738_26410 [Kitasatospora viridis]
MPLLRTVRPAGPAGPALCGARARPVTAGQLCGPPSTGSPSGTMVCMGRTVPGPGWTGAPVSDGSVSGTVG